MNKYGLIGSSVTHSYSKIIHSHLYKEFNVNASYELLSIDSSELKRYVEKLRSKEYKGFNVTVPYKEEILQYVDVIHDEIKSCNTLILIDDKVHAFNTDIYGFEYLLNYYDIKLNDVLILGSGGSSKSVRTILNNKNINYQIISRSNDGYSNLNTNNKEIINTTPIGMFPNTNSSVLSKELASKANLIIDLIYNPNETLLMSYNNKKYNGLVMLVAQAIKSFEIWFDISVDKKIIKKIINKVGELNE